MFKVYMDETGIHAGAPVVAVAAYVAKPGQGPPAGTEGSR
jgi:hypothetical protein